MPGMTSFHFRSASAEETSRLGKAFAPVLKAAFEQALQRHEASRWTKIRRAVGVSPPPYALALGVESPVRGAGKTPFCNGIMEALTCGDDAFEKGPYICEGTQVWYNAISERNKIQHRIIDWKALYALYTVREGTDEEFPERIYPGVDLFEHPFFAHKKEISGKVNFDLFQEGDSRRIHIRIPEDAAQVDTVQETFLPALQDLQAEL